MLLKHVLEIIGIINFLVKIDRILDMEMSVKIKVLNFDSCRAAWVKFFVPPAARHRWPWGLTQPRWPQAWVRRLRVRPRRPRARLQVPHGCGGLTCCRCRTTTTASLAAAGVSRGRGCLARGHGCLGGLDGLVRGRCRENAQ